MFENISTFMGTQLANTTEGVLIGSTWVVRYIEMAWIAGLSASSTSEDITSWFYIQIKYSNELFLREAAN